MHQWPADSASCTFLEIDSMYATNKAWNNELRFRINALVNSRLAKQIDLTEYTAKRKIVNEEIVECKRRRFIIDHEIGRRGMDRKL
jgi:hypothetical protein